MTTTFGNFQKGELWMELKDPCSIPVEKIVWRLKDGVRAPGRLLNTRHHPSIFNLVPGECMKQHWMCEIDDNAVSESAGEQFCHDFEQALDAWSGQPLERSAASKFTRMIARAAIWIADSARKPRCRARQPRLRTARQLPMLL